MKGLAVIGANYGDEGKGLVVDHLASLASLPVVVRYNGGAQAGHTVVTPSAKRHVFHTYGSGTFAGAPTFLTKHVVVNPALWMSELKELYSYDGRYHPLLMIDQRALVTTPWDMMINQLLEEHRGLDRHGSCGVGFNETITRSEIPRYRLTLFDMWHDGKRLSSIADLILKKYVPARLAQLGLYPPPSWGDLANCIFDKWILDARSMGEFGVASSTIPHCETVIFEGAQGLGLDQNAPHFPHVTRSNTGLPNILEQCQEWGITELDVYYVTRAYLTRHGRGHMEHYDAISYYDNTNVPNPWQGSLRFGRLEVSSLLARIRKDLAFAKFYPHIKTTPRLVVTHMDQMESNVIWCKDNKMQQSSRQEFICMLADATNMPILTSSGPTRNDIKEGYNASASAAPVALSR